MTVSRDERASLRQYPTEDIRQSRQQTGTRDDSACVEESIYDDCMSAFKGVGVNEHGRNHDHCMGVHLQEYDQEGGDPKLQIFCCHPAWNPFAFILIIKLKSRGNFENGKKSSFGDQAYLIGDSGHMARLLPSVLTPSMVTFVSG